MIGTTIVRTNKKASDDGTPIAIRLIRPLAFKPQNRANASSQIALTSTDCALLFWITLRWRPDFNPSTVNNCIWNLEVVLPQVVYKPIKDLFRLVKFKEPTPPEITRESLAGPLQSKLRDEVLYPLFANWLKMI